MRVALLTTDTREHDRVYSETTPRFGTAPEALLQGFAQLKDIEVHVVSCAQQPMTSPEKLADNIWFNSLHVPKLGWLRTGYQGCIRAVRRKLAEIKPDIVHGQGTERECSMSAIFSGFPNVVTIHGNMAELARRFSVRVGSYNWFAARLENFALRRTAGVFCNSAYTEDLVRPRAKKIWRVPNALRQEFFVAPASAGVSRLPVLLNVGVISPRKRQLELLGVAEALHRRGLKFEFHFIGDAPAGDGYVTKFLERLKPLAAVGCARHIERMGTKDLMVCFDAAAGLVHFPSEEAFGLVVGEALAHELKFFGARLGGITEIVAEVPGTQLFAAGDWAGLTEALADWLAVGSPRTNGAAAVMRARYHPEVVARRHLEIYQEVLKTVS